MGVPVYSGILMNLKLGLTSKTKPVSSLPINVTVWLLRNKISIKFLIGGQELTSPLTTTNILKLTSPQKTNYKNNRTLKRFY